MSTYYVWGKLRPIEIRPGETLVKKKKKNTKNNNLQHSSDL